MRTHSPFVVCSSCRCHVRSAAKSCPHCHSDLNRPGALKLLRAVRHQVRRQLFTVAAVGLGTGCGLVFQPPPQSAENNLGMAPTTVEGHHDAGGGVTDSGNGEDAGGNDSGLVDSGLADSGLGDSGLPMDSGVADAGPPDPNVWGECNPGDDCNSACICGYDGTCDAHGNCVSCGCPVGEYCITPGRPGFGLDAGQCSNHTCYGAPPLIEAALA